MTLTSPACTGIEVVSDYINDFQTDPSAYNSIIIAGTFNEGEEFSYEFTASIPTTGTYIKSVSTVETILPAFFEQTELSDGIYKVIVKLEDTDGIVVQEQACLFKDCSGLNCDVASKDAMYYYYVLENTCSCNCEKLYTIYEALLAEIEKPVSNESDCGCV